MLLSKYPAGGLLEKNKLYHDAMYPHDGSLQRLANRYGDKTVIHMEKGSVAVIPPGMYHAAFNLERCVSFNTTHVKRSVVGTLSSIGRTIQWFKSHEDDGGVRLMGSGFTLWVENVINLFLDDLRQSFASLLHPGHASFCLKAGYCMQLADLVERMVNVGCTNSSGLNQRWRSTMSSHIRVQVDLCFKTGP